MFVGLSTAKGRKGIFWPKPKTQSENNPLCVATNWMPIAENVKTIAEGATTIINPMEKFGEVSSLTSKLLNSYINPNAINLKTEVNHRPAAQEWTVCTP